jgi:membrane protease YdiL (CAAX protease family)
MPTLLGLVLGWFLLMQRFGRGGNIYAVIGPFALSVVLVVCTFLGRELRAWFLPTRFALLSAVLVGGVMTLATYPLFALLRSLVPRLSTDVATLYAAAQQTTLTEALLWMLAIIVAEELLWRGALVYLLARHVPAAVAMGISVLTYAAAQFGTGSWIVVLLALVCGTIWTVQRYLTGSLLAPLLAHLIWTPTVILLYPVTSV